MQLVNLALVAVLAVVVKIAMLVTPSNILVVPVAVLAIVPTLVLDRTSVARGADATDTADYDARTLAGAKTGDARS